MEDHVMRRVFSWGLPLYAAIMTGVFVGKGLPDNNLRAEGDPARSDTVNATASTPVTFAGRTGERQRRLVPDTSADRSNPSTCSTSSSATRVTDCPIKA